MEDFKCFRCGNCCKGLLAFVPKTEESDLSPEFLEAYYERGALKQRKRIPTLTLSPWEKSVHGCWRTKTVPVLVRYMRTVAATVATILGQHIATSESIS